MKYQNLKVAVIGMGYVGLPLAVEFAKKIKVFGFDINSKRIIQLKKGYDITNEVSKNNFKNLKRIKFTSSLYELRDCQVYIITVPTPVNKNNRPNLEPLIKATYSVSSVVKENDIVIYESTVYPGATEELCGPILEKETGLKINKNLFLGYSPERINPGDKKKKLTEIIKITSGSNRKTSNFITKLYSIIIKAGVHQAHSIKIAEAAKVIENAQRDLNIAFVNELSLIFKKMKISTEKVLKAAETKWNFISFRPGLVGGHCIGVDPYYLTYKSKKIGHNPKIILAGRKLNDQMSSYVFNDILNIIKKRKSLKKKFKVLIMGLTFKENCPDTRNSKILDLFMLLKKRNFSVSSYDPHHKFWNKSFKKKFNVIENIKDQKFDLVILAVKHKKFEKIKNKINNFCNSKGFIYDLKYLLPEDSNSYRL